MPVILVTVGIALLLALGRKWGRAGDRSPALPLAYLGVPLAAAVVATGAGSLMFSHVNDTGFWMFQQCFTLAVWQTFAAWSVMEGVVALSGLGAAPALQALT